MKLLYATRDEIMGKVSLIPVGSIEQHGPHLPMGTDAIIAEEIAKRVEEEIPDKVLLYPTIYYGCSFEHGKLPYVGVSYESFLSYVGEVVKSALSFSRGVIIINGHGGNQAILEVVKRKINFEERTGKLYLFSMVGRDKDLFNVIDMHAGSLETSRIYSINKFLVRTNKLKEITDYTVKEGVFDTLTTDEANLFGVINIGGKIEIDEEKGKVSLDRAANDLKKLVMKILGL
ncbi:MAG: creatininase family protein [Sulfolobus sp.]